MKIKLQKIEIDQEVKDRFNAAFKGKNLEITYYNGYLTKFDKCQKEISVLANEVYTCPQNYTLKGATCYSD
jgi:hypothetical protein